jgi:hypothetical protein
MLACENYTERQINKSVKFIEDHPDLTRKAFVNWGAILAISAFMSFKLITVQRHMWGSMTLMKIMANIPQANITNYLAALEKAPILIKSITSGIVYLFGDMCS